MDRFLIGMLMQPIKEELLLSDTQLGFLTGIAFAFFYATLGIPIARWADRGNRLTIISIAMALWGGMVMLCSVVTNFLQLALVRIGAAVGEAGCLPPAYSLIGDYFSVPERTRAFAIYMSGVSISIVISSSLAGWINELYGWRVAFLLIGAPGLLMAILVKVTLSEPRQYVDKQLESQEPPQRLSEVLIALWRQRTFRRLIIALTLVNFVGMGLGQWLPAFYIRNYGIATGELGLWIGLVGGMSGVMGTLCGGYLLDRYLADSIQKQMWCIAIGVGFLVPIYWLLLFTSDRSLALLLMCPLNILFSFFYGPVMGLIQRLVEDKTRAMAIATVGLILNLVAMGLGPQVVGIISDWLTPIMGTADSLRFAMAIAAVVSFGSVYYFWVVGRTIDHDLETIEDKKSDLVLG